MSGVVFVVKSFDINTRVLALCILPTRLIEDGALKLLDMLHSGVVYYSTQQLEQGIISSTILTEKKIIL